MTKDQFLSAIAHCVQCQNNDNRPTISDVVRIDDNFVTVRVSVTMPKDAPEVHLSSYFERELVKKIPALDRFAIAKDEDGKVCAITAIMKISVVDPDGEPNNTADDISMLRDMGGVIIKLVIDNSAIPQQIEAIAKDCACWIIDNEYHEESNDTQESR